MSENRSPYRTLRHGPALMLVEANINVLMVGADIRNGHVRDDEIAEVRRRARWLLRSARLLAAQVGVPEAPMPPADTWQPPSGAWAEPDGYARLAAQMVPCTQCGQMPYIIDPGNGAMSLMWPCECDVMVPACAEDAS